MAENKKAAEAAPAPSVPDENEIEEVSNPTWQFMNREPTVPEVLELLSKIKFMGTVPAEKYIDHVAALAQKKKVQRPKEGRPDLMVTEFLPLYSLYMSVAGRVAILNDIQAATGWCVNIYPEQNVSTGVRGYLRFDDKLVFRVYVDISDKDGRDLGSRFGTAWVPAEGGSNAAASNPFEKVETSALGRALGQWGIGILPGSGIATLEEMRSVHANLQANGGGPKQREAKVASRDDVISDLLTTMESVKQRRSYTDDQMLDRLRKYSTDTLGRKDFVTVDGFLDWAKLSDAQVSLMRNMFKARLQEIMDEEAPV